MPVAGRRLVTFFCIAKRKLPKKTRPRFADFPCVPQPNRALRNSRFALRQCSLKSSRFDFVAWRLRRDLFKNIPAQVRVRGLPRHGQRSLGCGSGSMSAPFNDMFAAACAPSRTTLRETESGALSAHSFVALGWLENNPTARLASRPASETDTVALFVSLC